MRQRMLCGAQPVGNAMKIAFLLEIKAVTGSRWLGVAAVQYVRRVFGLKIILTLC